MSHDSQRDALLTTLWDSYKTLGALWDLVDEDDNPTIFYYVEMANSKVSITSIQLH